jgi:hypothetical protein
MSPRLAASGRPSRRQYSASSVETPSAVCWRRDLYATHARPLATLAAGFGVRGCHLYRPSLFPTECHIGRDQGMPALASPRPFRPPAEPRTFVDPADPVDRWKHRLRCVGEGTPCLPRRSRYRESGTWWGHLPVIRHGPPFSARGMPRVIAHPGRAAVTREMGMHSGTRVD